MGREVSHSGFRIDRLASGVHMSDLAESLEKMSGVLISLHSKNLNPMATIADGWLLGTVVDYKKSSVNPLAEPQEDGEVLLKKVKLDPGTFKMSIALFAINLTTRVGCLATHRGAPSFTNIAGLLRRAHDEAVERLREQYRREHEEDPKAMDRAKRAIAGRLKVQAIMTKPDIETAAAEMSKVTGVEISAEEVAEEGLMTPLKSYATRARIIASLDETGASRSALRAALKEIESTATAMVSGKKRREQAVLTLIGRSAHNELLRVKIGDQMRHFGRFDYDEYILGTPDALSEFHTCSSMRKLRQTINENPQIFGEAEG